MYGTENLLSVLVRAPHLFETLLDNMPDTMVYAKDRNGHYVWGNRVLLDRAGVASRTELEGKTADFLFPSLGVCTLDQDLDVIRSARPSRDVLRCYRTRKGERIWCLSYKFPMFDDDGNAVGLVGLSKDLPRPVERHQSYCRLAQFLDYIDEHIEESVRIADAARDADLSMDALARLVVDVFNITPKQLMMRKRLERARRMLEDSDESIAEVSGACGYADHSAFTRHFKAQTRVTPVQYRATFRSVAA